MKTKIINNPIEQSLCAALGNLTITKADTEITISSLMSLSPSIPIFNGHFPKQPILPAVIQLTIVRLLCAEAVKTNLHNIFVGKSKFSSSIRPEENIRIEITLTETQAEYIAKFKFFNGDTQASSGTVTYNTVN